MSRGGKREKACDVGQRHVQHAGPPRDHQSERPDHEIRAEIVAPLMTEHGHAARCDEQQQRDGEVARIPQMAASIGEHVLGGNREKRAERKRPQQVRLRLDQQRKAYSRYVRARDIDDAAAQKPGKEYLGRDADAQGGCEPIVATENAVARLANDQHQGDEKDDEVLRIDAAQTPPDPARACGCLCGRGGHRAGSLMTCSWSMVRSFNICTVPDGQRIVTRPRRFGPKPKCRRRSFWLQNPVPPLTTCRCLAPPNSAVTSAPIALRLLRVPISLSSTQWPFASVLRYSKALPRSFAITTSSVPRLNRSASATERPSSRSVIPATSATSMNPSRPRLSSTRERSYPERLAFPMGGQFFASSKMLPCPPAIFDIAYQ